ESVLVCTAARRQRASGRGRRRRALIAFGAVPEGISLLLIVVLVLAVTFDYINGVHDTANANANSASTSALQPSHAILMSATPNFIGASPAPRWPRRSPRA